MQNTGFVLVSHSEQLADGLKEILEEMNDGSINIVAAGGTGDGHVGTNAVRIMDAIESIGDCENILLFCDLGSSILSADMALEMLDPELAEKAKIVDCPIVEGSFLAIVNAPAAEDVDSLIRSAEEARGWIKVNS